MVQMWRESMLSLSRRRAKASLTEVDPRGLQPRTSRGGAHRHHPDARLRLSCASHAACGACARASEQNDNDQSLFNQIVHGGDVTNEFVASLDGLLQVRW